MKSLVSSGSSDLAQLAQLLTLWTRLTRSRLKSEGGTGRLLHQADTTDPELEADTDDSGLTLGRGNSKSLRQGTVKKLDQGLNWPSPNLDPDPPWLECVTGPCFCDCSKPRTGLQNNKKSRCAVARAVVAADDDDDDRSSSSTLAPLLWAQVCHARGEEKKPSTVLVG